MIDHGAHLEPGRIPLFELEEPDNYSSYLLHSRAEIVAVLRSLIQKNALITVYFDHGQSFLLTSMIALEVDRGDRGGRGDFVVDFGSNGEMNQRALLADQLMFTTLVDKVKVQFSVDKLTQTHYEGRPAFLGAIPETLMRLQRREFFRLSTPVANPVLLNTTLKRDDGSKLAVELPLLDISGGGIGLMLTPEQAQLFYQGDVLEDCRINLPGEGLLSATFCVRNAFDVTARNGTRHVRVGCEFVKLPALRLTMVQRYITRVERERKARLSGLG